MKWDWPSIETEYVTGKMTMEKLAAKHNIPLNTFYKKAKDANFSQKREEYTRNIQEKAVARARARDVRTLANLGSALDKAARLLNRLIADEDTIHSKIVNHMDGQLEEVRTKKADTKAIRDLTAAIRDVGAALQGMHDGQQGRENESQAGVIILPEVDGEQ